MKLDIPKYGISLLLEENIINSLVIENSQMFTEIVGSLWQQTYEEGTGEFVLCDGDKEKDISRNIECVINPFALSLNDKKTLTRLYQEVMRDMETKYQEDAIKVKSHVIEYVNRVISTYIYDISVDFDFEFVDVLKMLKVRFDETYENLFDRVIQYVKVKRFFLGINNYIFVNLRQFFSTNEICEMLKSFQYEKINVILIDSVEYEKIENEKRIVIDIDRCIINMD